MSALPKQIYTLQEYFALDAVSDERLEYWNGEIYSMTGASKANFSYFATDLRKTTAAQVLSSNFSLCFRLGKTQTKV